MIANLLRATALLTAVALAGCNANSIEDIAPKTPSSDYAVSSKLSKLASARSMQKTSPIMMRIFKEENALEIWKQRSDGRYALITSYQMCRWSGKLGPKFTEGDRQAPEGFYNVTPAQLNPGSKYYLAFNLGYPNAYDRANGRSGTHLMVHGSCSSSGCYSLTDGQMQEVYALARDAFAGGQTSFQVQAFPFRMTAANMARYRNDPNIEFWTMLKEGYDRFEVAKAPPKVDVCNKRYVFNRTGANACAAQGSPQVADSAYQSYQASFASSYAREAEKTNLTPPRSSIQGTKEAAVVADWSKKRAKGERVSMEPPSMRSDGSIVASQRMGRIDSEIGRKQAAKDAKEAEAKRIAEEKKAAEEKAKAELAAKQEAIKLAKLEAARAKAEADEQAKVAKAEATKQQTDAKTQAAAKPDAKAPAKDTAAKESAGEPAKEEVATTAPAEQPSGVTGAAKAGVKKLMGMFGG